MFIEADGSLVIHGDLPEDLSNIELVKRVVEADNEHSSIKPSWMKSSHVHVDRAAQSSPIRVKHAPHKVTSWGNSSDNLVDDRIIASSGDASDGVAIACLVEADVMKVDHWRCF